MSAKKRGKSKKAKRANTEAQDSGTPFSRPGVEEPQQVLGDRPTPLAHAGRLFPAVLCVILVLRTFIDGIVHPQYNAIFIIGFLATFIGWGAWAMWYRMPILAPKMASLFAGFLIWSLFAFSGTVNADNTFHAFPVWATCLMLFVLGSSGLTTRWGQTWILAGFLLAAGAEAVYSILHVQLVLPRARADIIANPELLPLYFGSSEITPDIKHRLESNRAFGTFLFPNALAAFLVMAVPLSAAVAFDRVRALRTALRERAFIPLQFQKAKQGKKAFSGGPDRVLVWSVLYGLGAGVLGLVGMWFLSIVLMTGDVNQESILQNGVVYGLFVCAIPAILGVTTLVLIRRYGLDAAGLVLAGAFSPFVAVLAFWALALTQSRGAFLGLIVATLFTLILCRGLRFWRGAAVAGLAACAALALVAMGSADAQDVINDRSSQTLAMEGMETSRPSLADTTTVMLRGTYWTVGARMAMDNLLRGVGLGNFGVAYTRYQNPGEADVKMAHNDYLQMVCETGLAGGVLFTGFWAAFAIAGARVLRKRRDDRLLLGGLYAGVLAFALHQFVDFGMQNPTLTAWSFVLAGLFMARTASRGETPWRIGHGFAWALMLVSAAAVAGGAFTLRKVDVQLDSLGRLPTTLEAGRFLLVQTQQEPAEPGSKWAVPAPIVLSLVDNSNALEAIGWFQAPVPGVRGRAQRVPISPFMPPKAQFVVEYPAQAWQIGLRFAKEHIEDAKAVDAAYPYRPDLATHLSFWYELLLNVSDGPEKRAYAEQAVAWAEEAVERSPLQGWHHMWLGKSLWYLGTIVEGDEGLELLERGLKSYRTAAHYYRSAPDLWVAFAEKLDDFAVLMERMGREERVKELRLEARDVRNMANWTRQLRQAGR